jgi:hypothetical protein
LHGKVFDGTNFYIKNQFILQMQTPDYLPTLKRAGAVLLIMGVIDIGQMVYCIFNGIPYRSSLNIFAVIGGIFLIKGSLRAASIIRWIAVFYLFVAVTMVAAYPFIQPASLTMTIARLYAKWMAWTCLTTALFVVVIWWLVKQLSMPSVQQAREAAGKKKRGMYIPAALGVALPIALTISNLVMQNSESAKKAVSLAEHSVGENYQFTVESINFRSSANGSNVYGVVTAWNSQEILKVPFQWQE